MVLDVPFFEKKNWTSNIVFIYKKVYDNEVFTFKSIKLK